MILVTESAVKQLQVILAEEPAAGKGLRIFVEHGGCAGLQYGMSVDQPREGDARIECEGAAVYVDAESEPHLRGATLDYSDGLTGAGFRIQNPNAARSCGCGTSFEPAAPEKEEAARH